MDILEIVEDILPVNSSRYIGNTRRYISDDSRRHIGNTRRYIGNTRRYIPDDSRRYIPAYDSSRYIGDIFPMIVWDILEIVGDIFPPTIVEDIFPPTIVVDIFPMIVGDIRYITLGEYIFGDRIYIW